MCTSMEARKTKFWARKNPNPEMDNVFLHMSECHVFDLELLRTPEFWIKTAKNIVWICQQILLRELCSMLSCVRRRRKPVSLVPKATSYHGG